MPLSFPYTKLLNCIFGFIPSACSLTLNYFTYFHVMVTVRLHLVFSLSRHLRVKPFQPWPLWLEQKDIIFCLHRLNTTHNSENSQIYKKVPTKFQGGLLPMKLLRAKAVGAAREGWEIFSVIDFLWNYSKWNLIFIHLKLFMHDGPGHAWREFMRLKFCRTNRKLWRDRNKMEKNQQF